MSDARLKSGEWLFTAVAEDGTEVDLIASPRYGGEVDVLTEDREIVERIARGRYLVVDADVELTSVSPDAP